MTGVCSFCSQSLFNCKILVQTSTCCSCRLVLIFTFCSDMMFVLLCVAHFCVTSYCFEKFLVSMSLHVPRIFFFSFITVLVCIENQIVRRFYRDVYDRQGFWCSQLNLSYVYRQHFCMTDCMCSSVSIEVSVNPHD